MCFAHWKATVLVIELCILSSLPISQGLKCYDCAIPFIRMDLSNTPPPLQHAPDILCGELSDNSSSTGGGSSSIMIDCGAGEVCVKFTERQESHRTEGPQIGGVMFTYFAIVRGCYMAEEVCPKHDCFQNFTKTMGRFKVKDPLDGQQRSYERHDFNTTCMCNTDLCNNEEGLLATKGGLVRASGAPNHPPLVVMLVVFSVAASILSTDQDAF